MDHAAIEQVPDALVGDGIVPDHQRRELFLDDVGLIHRHRSADAGDAVVGLDFAEDARHRVVAVVDFGQPARALVFVFRVDVDGADEAFFPEFAVEFHRAVDFEDVDCGNFHACSPLGIRE